MNVSLSLSLSIYNIHIYICTYRLFASEAQFDAALLSASEPFAARFAPSKALLFKIHQRGGAVETGCSDLYDVMY